MYRGTLGEEAAGDFDRIVGDWLQDQRVLFPCRDQNLPAGRESDPFPESGGDQNLALAGRGHDRHNCVPFFWKFYISPRSVLFRVSVRQGNCETRRS